MTLCLKRVASSLVCAVFGLSLQMCGRPTALDVASERVRGNAFDAQVRVYLRLRDELAVAAPPAPTRLTGSVDIDGASALAKAIGQARRNARAGDVFNRDIAQDISERVRISIAALNPDDRQAIFDELEAPARIRVNDVLPSDLPLPPMPPRLLAQLRPLPETLQYRFLGRALVLIDIDTGLIVDVIDGVLV